MLTFDNTLPTWLCVILQLSYCNTDLYPVLCDAVCGICVEGLVPGCIAASRREFVAMDSEFHELDGGSPTHVSSNSRPVSLQLVCFF